MITIRDDSLGIEVSGETGRGASRKLAAARRKVKKENARRKRAFTQASLLASNNARRIYEWLPEIRLGVNESFPRGIRKVNPFVPRSSCCHARVRKDDHGYVVIYETEEGRFSFDHYGFRPVFGVENGAGFCIAVVLQDLDRPGWIEVDAIGSFDGSMALLPVVTSFDEFSAAFAKQDD